MRRRCATSNLGHDVLENVALRFVMPSGFFRCTVDAARSDLVRVLPVAILKTGPAILGFATSQYIRSLDVKGAIQSH